MRIKNTFTIENGVLQPSTQIASPNFNERPKSGFIKNNIPNNLPNISLLVIHNISLPPKDFGSNDVCDFFCNQLDCKKHDFYKEIDGIKVSSHLFIRRNGEVIQFVNFNNRAWHAGKSSYKNVENCNDFSIGVELEGCDDIEYTNEQYQTLISVTKKLIKTYPNIKNNITGHEHIAPGRKTDPGIAFDWNKYLSNF